jgi:FtsH-binding integral membrane protein
VYDTYKSAGIQTQLSTRVYIALVCFWTALGILSSAVSAWVGLQLHLTPVMMLVLLGVAFVSGLAGTSIALDSDKPVVSMTGYAMVSIPFGLLLGPAVAQYTETSVLKIFLVTIFMVVILGAIGAAYPRSLGHWGSYLLGSLLILLLGQLMVPFAALAGVPIEGAMTILDWVGVVIFSLYVVHDLNQAMDLEPTHDNAIDVALGVYLNVLNLFLRLLQLFGQHRD